MDVFKELPMCFVQFLFVAVLLGQSGQGSDICGKFHLGGPCPENTEPTTTPSSLDAYCQWACAQDEGQLMTSCHCPGEVTTLPPTTTTPRPESCYYTRNRPARLRSLRKRLWKPSPVVTQCQYPGIVGLFRIKSGVAIPICTASLVGEDTLLINEANCYNMVKMNTTVTYVLGNSYLVSSLSKAITVLGSTAKLLDPTGDNNKLYTVKMSAPLTLNSDCIQPICIPNGNLPSTDIDFNDCRVVGYGEMNDTMGSKASQLMEVLVRVDPTSLATNNLKVIRLDGQPNTPCFTDDSAPLICSHVTTKEWVTVAITTSIGFSCSTGVRPTPVFWSLLREAKLKVYYNGLQLLPYMNPDLFPAK